MRDARVSLAFFRWRATEALKRKRWQPFFGVASSAGLKKLRKYTRDLLQ